MSAQAALPLISPTVRGMVEGIICLDPFTLQCQECGDTATAETVGVRPDRHALIVILSHFRFHALSWPDGSTDNPRLCRPCRQSRACPCESCRFERGR